MAGRFPATWLINYSAEAGEVSGQLASEPVSEEGNKSERENGGLVGRVPTAPHAHLLADSL